MARTKRRKFNAGAVVREIARERVGQPKPTAVIADKRNREKLREMQRNILAAVRGE